MAYELRHNLIAAVMAELGYGWELNQAFGVTIIGTATRPNGTARILVMDRSETVVMFQISNLSGAKIYDPDTESVTIDLADPKSTDQLREFCRIKLAQP